MDLPLLPVEEVVVVCYRPVALVVVVVAVDHLPWKAAVVEVEAHSLLPVAVEHCHALVVAVRYPSQVEVERNLSPVAVVLPLPPNLLHDSVHSVAD